MVFQALRKLFGGSAASETAAAPKPRPTPTPRITGVCIGESLVGDGNEVAHIDLIIGPRGSAAEKAFAKCLDQQQSRLHRPAGGRRP